jgi:hypothetical protein
VDQISPPFRIAIVAMLAVCALWFTVLKPKDPGTDTAASDPTAPGVTGLSKDVTAAKGAAAKSDAANAKVQAATGGVEAKADTTATAKSKSATTGAHAAVAGKNAPSTAAKAKTTDASAPLLRALDRKDTVVLLFWNRRGSDDRAVRRAVRATARHHGHVVVKAAPVAQVARYGAITSGVQVLQSPTVLVIGPDRKARAVTGFTTKSELDQVVSDTLKAAKPAKKK